jgi:hypothetical protein
VIVCIVGALMLSAGFVASGLAAYGAFGDMRKSLAFRAVRGFYFPHTVSAGLILDALEVEWTRDANRRTAYLLWFFASLPASLTYMLAGIGGVVLIRRSVKSS